jgi:ribosomal protein L37AE/L43A
MEAVDPLVHYFLQNLIATILEVVMIATRTASTRRSVYGMTCNECGKGLIAPGSSEFVNEQCVRHIWHCTTCNNEFEMSAYVPTDSNSQISDEKMRSVFLSDLAA